MPLFEKASMKIPLLDLKPQYRAIRREVRTAIDEVLASQQFILGPNVRALEEEIARYCGSLFAIGVSSGTDALLASLMALGIGRGDEVITTPYSFFATAGCVARCGAKSVFVDIDPATYNIDPALIEAKITKRTKAIIPVHLFGQCAEMSRIIKIASAHSLFVIEDAAQAIGARYRRKGAGSMGDVGTISFFPSKNLGAFGDGGMIVTDDPNLAERMRKLRMHGSSNAYYYDEVGGNFRLDELQAAILRVKLRHLDRWSGKRRENGARYGKMIEALGLGKCISCPRTSRGNTHIYNQYVIRVKDRDGLKEFLALRGIGSAVYYPLPLHLQKCFADLRHREGDFPESESAARETLALPVYPEMGIEAQKSVVRALRDFYRGRHA